MANPNDELDLSTLLPLHDDNRTGDENLVSLFEEQHGVLSNQQYIEQHHEQYQTPESMDKEIISITEDDILNILGRTEIVTDTNEPTILPMGDENAAITTAVTSDIVSGIFNSADTVEASKACTQSVKGKAVTESQVIYSEHSLPKQTSVTSPKANLAYTKPPEIPVESESLGPSTQTKALGTIPFKINLPPGLPAGRYVLKNSVADPSVIELSFPDAPEYKPLYLPIVSQSPLQKTTDSGKKSPNICFNNVNANNIPETQKSANPSLCTVPLVSYVPTCPVSTPSSLPNQTFTVRTFDSNYPRQEPVSILKQQNKNQVLPSTSYLGNLPQVSTVGESNPGSSKYAVTNVTLKAANAGTEPGKATFPVAQVPAAPLGTNIQLRPMFGELGGSKPVFLLQNPPQTCILPSQPQLVTMKRNDTNLVKKVQVVNTSSGPQKKLVMTIDRQNGNKQRSLLPESLTQSSGGGPGAPSLGSIQQHIAGGQLVNLQQPLPNVDSAKSLSTHVPSLAGTGMNTSSFTVGPPSLAPITGLLNFAQLKAIPGLQIKNIDGDAVDFIAGRPRKTAVQYEARPVIPRSIRKMPHPFKDIEGLSFSPRSLLFQDEIEPSVIEVNEEVGLVPSIPTRGRTGKCNHTMVVIPIPDQCLTFLNDAHSLHTVNTTINRMKLAARYVKQESGSTDKIKGLDKNDRPTCEDPRRKPKPVSTEKTEDGTGTATLAISNECESDDGSYDYNEALYKEKKTAYRAMLKEQESKRLKRMSVLDTMIGDGPPEAALAKLYLRAPRLVDDPLEDGSGSPMYYCCYLCPFASYNESKVSVHWTITHLRQNPYICAYCPAQFAASGKAHRHIELAHPALKPVIKLVPSEHFSNDIQMEFLDGREPQFQVLPLVHHSPRGQFVNVAERYICLECGLWSGKEMKIQEHVRAEHMVFKPFKCKACNKGFQSVNVADAHRCRGGKDGPVPYTVNNQLLKLMCKLRIEDFYCRVPHNWPAKFVPESKYWVEVKRPTDDGTQMLCKFCTFEIESLDGIWKHVREEHHLPLGVFCNRCSAYRGLTTKEREHEFFICCRCCTMTSLQLKAANNGTVESIRLLQIFRCVKCPEQSNDLSALKRHIREHHVDVQPYYCTLCNEHFSSRQIAQKHGKRCHGAGGCIEKDVSLIAQVTEQVRKLYAKYMYPEPKDAKTRLSTAWTAYGEEVINGMSEQRSRPSKKEEQGDNQDIDVGGAEQPSEVDETSKKQPLQLLPPGIRRIQAEPYESFEGRNHYRCIVCEYKCIDRSCMSRHVKYMHLRIHPHSCPYCGYSNVEKTKVKLHILNLHQQSSKKVKTNITLVSALGEESKKHFVRVTPEGKEVSQTDPQNKSVQASTSSEAENNDRRHQTSPGEVDELSTSIVSLEPLQGAQLYGLEEDEVDDEHVRQIQRDLKALEASPVPGMLVRNQNIYDDVQIKDEPYGSDEDSFDFQRPIVRTKRSARDMDIELEPAHKTKKRRKLAHGPTTSEHSQRLENRNKRTLGQNCSKNNPKRIKRIYMDPCVQDDYKLFMVPVVMMEDIVAKVLSGK